MGSTLSQLTPYTTTIPLAVLATFLAFILAYSRFTPPVPNLTNGTDGSNSTPSPKTTTTRIPGAFDASADGERSSNANRKKRRKRAKKPAFSSATASTGDVQPSSTESGLSSELPPVAEARSKTKTKSNPSTAPATTQVHAAGESDLHSPTTTTDHDSSLSGPTPGSQVLTRSQWQSTTSFDTDSSWTRVESRARRSQHGPVSDAATTTTGDDDHDRDGGNESGSGDRHQHPGQLSLVSPSLGSSINLPPRNTDVNHIDLSGHSDIDSQTGDDDDDSGWGVVKSRPRSHRTSAQTSTPVPRASALTSSKRAPETLTKRQRQNANRRDAQKAAKAEAETQRLLALAHHRAGNTNSITT